MDGINIPAGSLSQVRSAVINYDYSWSNRSASTKLLWALRQAAPNLQRVAMIDLGRTINVELTALLSFPALHSFVLHESRIYGGSSWVSPYYEYDKRTDGSHSDYMPWIPAHQAFAGAHDHYAYTADDTRPVNKQWQQLKEKCHVWFKYSAGGQYEGLQAATTFTEYVPPTGSADDAQHTRALPPPALEHVLHAGDAAEPVDFAAMQHDEAMDSDTDIDDDAAPAADADDSDSSDDAPLRDPRELRTHFSDDSSSDTAQQDIRTELDAVLEGSSSENSDV